MKNRIKFERRTDVVISIILIMTFVISFFVSEQNNKLFFNVLFIVVGIIGAIYLIHSASLLLIKRIEFDWILVKGNFLHKVFNIVLIVPIVLTVIFILSELRLQNKDAGKDVFASKTEAVRFQKSLAKKLIFSETIYYKYIDTISLDSADYHDYMLVGDMFDWKPVVDDGKYYYIKEKDMALDDVVNGADEEPSAFWSVYYHYIDPGNQHITASENGRRWSAVMAVSGYVLLNGLMIAVLIGWFDRRRSEWVKGTVRYSLRHFRKDRYAVVIGANEVAASVIKKLLTKDKKKINYECEGDNEYVILQTCREAQNVRDELASYLNTEELSKVVIYKALRDSRTEIKKLYLKYATEIYVLGEKTSLDGGDAYHDTMNMRCVNMITQVLKDTKTDERKVCKVMFEYQTTNSVFQFSDVSDDIKESLIFVPFNRYESWARKVMVESFSDDGFGNKITYTPLDGKGISKNSDEHVHLVIVGMSKMGVAMGVLALSHAHYVNYAAAEMISNKEERERKKNKTRTRITFIDTNADKEMALFKSHYENLFSLARHRYIDIKDSAEPEWNDPMQKADCKWRHLSRDAQNFIDVEIEFVKGELESEGVRDFLLGLPDSKLTIAICLPQTNKAVAASLYMPTEIYERTQEIWVYQREASDIVRNLEVTKTQDRRYKKLRPFGMLYGEYMSDRAQYLRAMLVNWAYEAEENKKGWPSSVADKNDKIMKSIIDSWNRLQLDKQWSNRYFADSIYLKIRDVLIAEESENLTYERILELLRNDDDFTEKLGSMMEDDALAISEHNRWNMQQLLLGYSPCDAELDRIFEKINNKESDEIVRKDYQEWKKKNHVGESTSVNIKKDVKESELRMHPNICEYEHLDIVDSDAKSYDKMLNTNAIPEIILLVDAKMQ